MVNPERRERSVPPEGEASPLPPSSVLNRLFPPEPTAGGDAGLRVPAGFELGHFVIEERIGIGGMGAVFRARDRRLQRVVALKVLSPLQSRDPASVQRFYNEARAAAQLDHENIARVYSVGEDQGLFFIAFEFVTGTNVQELILAKGRLEPDEALNYALQIATALRHTAAAGVVHRDIKPSNIIITPQGRAKLVDLGLARKESSEATGELTIAGTTLGTFDYISPEQAKDPRRVDVRSDMYSLGCTLYHMVTGEPPYPEGTVLQKLLDHQGNDPPDAREKNRAVPVQLAAIIKKMMASDPDRRYHAPEDLSHDLIQVAGHLGLHGVPPDGLVWVSRRRFQSRLWERHVGWIASAALLLLIVVFLAISPDFGQTGAANRHAADTGADESSVSGAQTRTAQKAKGVSDAAVPAEHGPKVAALKDELNRAGQERHGDGPDAGPSRRGADSTRTGRPEDGEDPASRDRASGADGSPTAAQTDGAPRVRDEDAGQNRSQKTAGSRSAGTSTPRTVTSKSAPAEAPSETRTAVPAPDLPPRWRHRTETAAVASRTREPEARQPDLAQPPPPAISIDGQSYRTLEAACADAEDGDVIELRFDGPREEEPLRVVGKKVTIRAVPGYRPRITFRPERVQGDVARSRMITVTRGEVALIDVNLRMAIREMGQADRWALFLLTGSERVQLKGVGITVSNPHREQAAVFESVSDAGSEMLSGMTRMNSGQERRQRQFELQLDDGFVRGDCDFCIVRHTRSGSLDIRDSVVAVNGAILHVLGNLNTPEDGADLELGLEHVTGVTNRGLVRVDSGTEGRYIVPLRISMQNSLLATAAGSPLIAMTGNTNLEDFKALLRSWNGDWNFYDGFETFWSVESTSPLMTSSDRFDFERWKTYWRDAETHSDIGGILWESPWQDRVRRFSRIVPDDLKLEPNEFLNRAYKGAIDGSPVGADVAQFSSFGLSSAEESATAGAGR